MGSQPANLVQLARKRAGHSSKKSAADADAARSSSSAQAGYAAAGAVMPASFARIPVLGPEDRPSDRPTATSRHPYVALRRQPMPGADGNVPEAEGAQSAHVHGYRRADKQESAAERTPVPPDAEAVLRTGGAPIPQVVRADMERQLGHDFGRVRVHAGPESTSAAERLQAAAFTVGEDVVFGAGSLAIQTRDGRALLLHELRHVVEQRTGARPREVARQATGQRVPQASGQAAPVLSDPKDRIMEALGRNDSVDFLNRLWDLTAAQRSVLDGDADFLHRVHRILHGLSFWSFRLILRFGNNRPVMTRQLYDAVHERRALDILDMLRSFPDLRDETKVPGVVDMLGEELHDTPIHGPILSVATARVTATSLYAGGFSEAHFDVPKGGGPVALMSFPGSAEFTLTRAGAEIRVLVRIRFVRKSHPSETFDLPEKQRAGWRNAIESAWNGRFTVFNGTTRLNVVFVPMFVLQQGDSPDFTVTMDEGSKYVRANETNWWLGQEDSVAAHEFGHMVGDPDEYGLPAHAADIPAAKVPDPSERRRSSVEGLGPGVRTQPSPDGGLEALGLMGRNVAGSRAEARHAWLVLDQINSTMRAAGEAPFQLEMR